ncbi:MAG: ABC transporter ATP-binding protein [Candidatus Eisenbacteria bacterium]|nr:ABC transporter ATP-binding protein [Candidatus Eisenbacteria bacterium]
MDTFPFLDVEVDRFGYDGTEVLRDVRLRFDRPGLAALLGPNGSGKSTLLRIAAGLAREPGCRVRIHGKDLTRMGAREAAALVAWVPQRAEAVFAMSVREMVRVGRFRAHGVGPARGAAGEEERIEAALESVGMLDLAHRDVDTLSGGEWQRALIARAVAQDTPVMLLDEPVASLDLRYQDEIYQLLRALASQGRAILVADHHIDLAACYCDRLLLLREGRIDADGPPSVLQEETIARVFGIRTAVFPDPVTGTPRVSRPRGRT